MTHEIQIAQSTFLSTHIKKRISVGGIDVDEDFVKELLIKHLRTGDANDRPTLSDAFDIYMAENTSAHRRKFKLNANQYFNRFSAMYGDLHLHIAVNAKNADADRKLTIGVAAKFLDRHQYHV
jgi:hypothetical protein